MNGNAAESKPAPRKRRIGWVLASLLFAGFYFLSPWPLAERAVIAILVAAMVLWVGEILPLGITALASSLALVLLVGTTPKAVFAAYFDPVVLLLLGGFLLGVALRRHRLDEALAVVTLRYVGTSPAIVLLALMGITAIFSMWVSNTATAAIILPIAASLVGAGPPTRGRAFVLGIAAAANIGGVATPIGTPANAIALRFLADAGVAVTFLGWMARVVPLAIVLVLVAWLILLRTHPVGGERIVAPGASRGRLAAVQWRLMVLFAATVMAWLTVDWHGIDAAVVAGLAGVALFALRLLEEGDLSKVNWDTLLLIGGGIALGDAVQSVGLDDRLATSLADVGTAGSLVALAALVGVAILLTLVSSNTAAAVLLVPLALLWAGPWDVPVRDLAMVAAVAVSFDFLVPMGTPPNALARATGLVDVRGMLRSGVPITLASACLLVLAAYWFW